MFSNSLDILLNAERIDAECTHWPDTSLAGHGCGTGLTALKFLFLASPFGLAQQLRRLKREE
jgi:hypothetical protein